MVRGLYASASGLLAAEDVVSAVAANLANAATPGYKAETTLTEPFGQMLLEALGPTGALPLGSTVAAGTAVQREAYDLAEGPLVHTGNPLDVAVLGPGFFAVATPQGVRYTRDGSFHVDPFGRLTDAQGNPVLGVGGRPVAGLGPQASIGPDGTVREGGAVVGRLLLVDLRTVVQENQGLFQGVPAPDTTSRLLTGTLEEANVDDTAAAMATLAALSAYQLSADALSAGNTTLDVLVNQVGRVG